MATSPQPADRPPQPRVVALPLSTSQRLVAALCHLFAVIPIWGLVADFWIWHTRREEHPDLRFQAAQAIYLQAVWLLLTVIFILALLFFKLLALLDEELSATLINANWLVWLAITAAIDAAALWGAITVRLRGRWEYPVLGAALRREMRRSEAEERQQGGE